MKIGILNFQQVNWNYGAVLLAAALQYEIEKLGHTAQNINFCTLPLTLLFLSQKSIKFCIKFCVKKILGIEQYGDFGSKKEFELFRKNWIKRTKKFYTFRSLQKYKFDYDAVIVGSDQIWRWSFIGNKWLKIFFLGFLPESTKRISYAASFGFDYWEKEKEDKHTLEAKNLLEKFSAVSVREKSGIKICKDIFNVSAEFVLDPVLLAGREFFDKVIENSKVEETKQNTIVYYLFDERLADAVVFLEKELSVSSQSIYYKKVRNTKIYNSVPNFLKQIKECKIMITDSFHGTCLAIIFEKPFISIVHPENGASRLESLLEMCGLKECLINEIHSEENLKNALSFAMRINWNNVNQNLENMRNISREFLKNNLKGK